jgi:hypothetical protein
MLSSNMFRGFRVGLTRRKRLPIIYWNDRQIYPWQILPLLWRSKRVRQFEQEGFIFCNESKDGLSNEWGVWKKYLPPRSIARDALILDVGARDGDTALFYCLNGFRNLRLVEPNQAHHHMLDNNVRLLRKRFDARIEVRKTPFDRDDLNGVKFVKFDCEGCESEIDLDRLNIPYVAELHVKGTPNSEGIYDYISSRGIIQNY